MTDTPEIITPDEARAQVAEMNADKDHPLHDPGHMKHPQAIDRLQTLLTAQMIGLKLIQNLVKHGQTLQKEDRMMFLKMKLIGEM